MGREELSTLRTQALEWPTPTAMGNHSVAGTKAGDGLTTVARTWPTPTTANAVGSTGGATRQSDLRSEARSWPTPKARDIKTHQGQDSRNTPDLPSVASRHHPTTVTVGRNGSPLVDLNPCFVAALMGVPLNWLMPSHSVGTEQFRQWYELHSTSSSPAPKRSRRAPPWRQQSLFATHDES